MGGNLPSQDVLRALLDYDPLTGLLTWRARGVEWFRDGGHSADHSAKIWNAKNAGRAAFANLNKGYACGPLFGRTRQAHRVIWKWMTGSDAAVVDHINGQPNDNRWENLRSVTMQGNMRNTKRPSHNRSGVIGVGWCAYFRRWKATIHIGGGKRKAGYRDTFDEAVALRKGFEAQYGFHVNHGRVQETARGR